MKRLLALAILAALIYGGYLYYQSQATSSTVLRPPTSSQINLVETPKSLNQLGSVLGEQVSRIWDSSMGLLNGATDGAAEPVINKAVSDLQSRVKDLPKEQYEKVKYEFCKDVVENYAQP